MSRFVATETEERYQVSTDGDRYRVSAGSDRYIVSENEPEYLFYDTADGISIDTDKWEITNEDPDKLKIHQNNGLIIERVRSGATAAYLDNAVKTKDSFTTGVVKFSAVALNNQVATSSSYVKFGILYDEDNAVEFKHRTGYDNKIACTIKKTGQADIELGGIHTWLVNMKIIITSTTMSVWIWENDMWLQLSTTQTVNIGAFKIFLNSRGGNVGMVTMKNIFITKNDFTSLNP